MPKNVSDPRDVAQQEKPLIQPFSRRNFLNYAGLSASAMLLATSCKKELNENDKNAAIQKDSAVGSGHDKPKEVVNLGSGDFGILNYAYALEQLEAAFYEQVIATPYSGISSKEMEYLKDVRDHEIAHREFFKNALGNRRIGGLKTNFTSIDFSSRASVLGTAKALEDTGVSAYNGAGELLESATYLLLAGKIVSVEARHAAAIRDLLVYGSFADSSVVDGNALDVVRTPPEVLAIASNFTYTKIISNNLPTS
ncbi:MAG: ferritin-like domain-containing protein [Ginsengibacter sp.]